MTCLEGRTDPRPTRCVSRWSTTLLGFALPAVWLAAVAPASGQVPVSNRDSASGQELDVRLASPGSPAERCPTWTPPPASRQADSAQVAQLASAASEASVLGDFERARELLELALEQDPGSAELNYRYARALEDLGAPTRARAALCRVISVDHDPDRLADAEARYAALGAARRAALPEPALQAFDEAARAVSAGRHERAAELFGIAADQAPAWAEAQYNRGLMLARLGDGAEGARYLRRYLELVPNAEDAVPVARRIGQLEGRAEPREVSSLTALGLGLVLPGLGQFYSGRARMGTVVFSAGAGVLAAGFLHQEVHVRCLGSFEPGHCPDAQVVSREMGRPFLTHALYAAGAVTVIGAVEAFFDARRRGSESFGRETSREADVRITGPALGVGPNGTELSLVGISFR